MNSKKILLSAAVLFFGLSEAQLTKFYTAREDYKYDLAENLYQTKIYGAAQYEYAQQYFYNESLSDSRKEAARFFDNVIGVIYQKNHAEEGLEAFMKDYPNSAYFAQANMLLADYYLAKKDFAKALETLQKVNQYQLSRDENTQYVLKLGYAKFMSCDANCAIDALEEAYTAAKGSEKNDVAYMLGHLYYSNKESDKAFSYFDPLKTEPKYGALIRPYYLQMYFNNMEYDRAISEGNDMLNTDISNDYRAEVHKIIGESYFMKDDEKSAYPHLKNYLETQQSPSDSDLYEMGFVCARLAKFDEAVEYYNQLLNSNSAMSQNAYYQLGNAYLQTGKKQEALSAYRSAYQMSYDRKVQQLAHAQYSKLSYDIGNPFEAAPKVIQSFISKYPTAPQTAELRALLVKSYLYSGDFRETLAVIDKMPNSTRETDKIDQEVSFLLAAEEFNKGNIDEAEKYFLRSLELKENPAVTTRATYWLAQTYYQKGNYPSAIVRYEKLLGEDFTERQQLDYDLGYAYFKSKKFDKAKAHFLKYLKNPDPEFKNDAELRLADTYYANNELNEAIALYDKAENADDYTLFQKAMAMGFKGDLEAKISVLKNLNSKFPNSEYADDAWYETATAYASIDDYNNSTIYFDKVIKSGTDKDLVANAQIYRAQNYIDQNQPEKALAELKNLGNLYRNTAYAAKIVQAARPIFVKDNKLSDYEIFAKSLGVNIDASELDEITLTSARNFYAKKDYKSAIPLYEKYLAKNPSSDGRFQAQYELGESHYQTKNFDKSLIILQEVAAVQNDYQQDAQTRIAQIFIAQDNAAEAKKYLESLVTSSDAAIKNFATIELMKIYADEKDFVKAEILADEVLKNNKNAAGILEGARVIKARSLMNKGKDKDAQMAFAVLEKSTNTEVAAEALYAKAFFQNKVKAYKTSNETIFKLANNFAAEEYWGAKALLVMARNYIGLKDNYQASYTADQIIANYQDNPEIVAEARLIKKSIKK